MRASSHLVFKNISEFGHSLSYNGAFRTSTRTPNTQQRGAATKPAALGFYITFGIRTPIRIGDEQQRLVTASVNVLLQSRFLPARGCVGLEVHRCLCIVDAGNVFISLFLRLWANTSPEEYLRAHRHGGSCGSQPTIFWFMGCPSAKKRRRDNNAKAIARYY
jgi:hypothetical protein